MVKFNNRKLIFSILNIFLFSFISCKENIKESCKDEINITQKASYKINTFKNKDSSWSYDIIKNNKIIIHQTIVPALDGNVNFRTQEEAFSLAKLVVEKLNRNIFPPSLTIEEVKSVITRN